MSIEGPIQTKDLTWGPPGIIKFTYTAPDGRFWNVDRVTGEFLQLWTVDPWGTTQTTVVRETEFRETWNEFQPIERPSRLISEGRAL